MSDGLRASIEKMERDGLPEAAIATFRHYYEQLAAGESGMMPEDELDPVTELPDAEELPPGEPRVVFHAMTRLHVPPDRLDAFDAALASLGRDAPLYRLSLEGRGELALRGPTGELVHLAKVGPRLEWVAPLDR